MTTTSLPAGTIIRLPGKPSITLKQPMRLLLDKRCDWLAARENCQTTWKLLLEKGWTLSIHETARASGASPATISIMRRKLRELREAGVEPPRSWDEARRWSGR